MNGLEVAGWHEAGHTLATLAVGATVEYASLAQTAVVLPSDAPGGIVALGGPCAEAWARNPRHGLPPWTRWPDEWQADLEAWQKHAGMRLAAADLADPADPTRARWRADVEEAQRIIRRNRPLLLAVAIELVARRRLTGREIALIAGSHALAG